MVKVSDLIMLFDEVDANVDVVFSGVDGDLELMEVEYKYDMYGSKKKELRFQLAPPKKQKEPTPAEDNSGKD